MKMVVITTEMLILCAVSYVIQGSREVGYNMSLLALFVNLTHSHLTEETHLKHCLDQIGHWTSLWGIFLIIGGSSPGTIH